MRWLLRRWEYVLPLVVGIALRVLYVHVTHWDVRGHDVGGHIEYVHFLLDRWVLPPADGGFQFYQPPLYYFFSALAMKAFMLVSDNADAAHRLLQWISALMTFGVLGVCAWITSMLFPRDTQKTQRFLFLSSLAVVPSIVYFSARINNDVLYLAFAYLAVALLLWWWRKPSAVTWLLLCNVLGIGLLAKTNMVLLCFPVLAALLLRPKLEWWKRGLMGLAYVVIPFCIAGWFVVPPFLSEDDKRAAVVGNVEMMTGPIPNEAKYLLVFNPVQVLANPFNEISGEGSRRLYLWEYTYRSALFGEFSYVPSLIPLALAMLVSSMILCLFALYEGFRDILKWRASPTMPLWMIAGVTLLGAFAFRIAMPFSSSQDFRYSIVLLVPLCYYAFCRKHLKGRNALLIQEVAAVVCLTASLSFVVLLAVLPG